MQAQKDFFSTLSARTSRLNFAVVGPSEVGKTTLLDQFKANWKGQTQEDKSILCQATIDETPVELELREFDLSSFFTGFPDVVGILAVYDVTCAQDKLNWLDTLTLFAEIMPVVLVGTKCDLMKERTITAEHGKTLAKQFGYQFIETSAIANINVNEAFFIPARILLSKILEDHELIAAFAATSLAEEQTPFAESKFPMGSALADLLSSVNANPTPKLPNSSALSSPAVIATNLEQKDSSAETPETSQDSAPPIVSLVPETSIERVGTFFKRLMKGQSNTKPSETQSNTQPSEASWCSIS